MAKKRSSKKSTRKSAAPRAGEHPPTMVGQPPALGKTIQTLRKEKTLSLDELARRSHVSKAMLSQIEQGKANPTVATVWKIAQGLSMSLNDLLAGSVVDKPFEIVRSENAPVLRSGDGGCEIVILSPFRLVDDLEIYRITFKPEAELPSAPHMPNTEELLTVIKGEFEVSSGEMSARVHPGDSIHYTAGQQHSIRNLQKRGGEIYLAVHFRKE
jgi:transcriptional regulator with XRE-family HTH domain